MNKIKIFKNNIIACICMTFALISCADLDEDPSISNLAPGAYSSQEELELGVTGIYGKLRDASQWTSFYVTGFGGDDITTHKVSNKIDFRAFDIRSVNGANSKTVGVWKDVYAMIRTANLVLESAEDLVLSDASVKDRLLGEVYFLRGTLFFHLARTHGRIPLPLTSEPDFEIALSSQLEVYEQIESDLLLAEKLLPSIYPDVNAGAPRPNSGSARAILARLYMDWAGFPLKDNTRYNLAASSAKQVIDNAGSHGFGLLDDLEDLWSLNNRFNKESVWSISYCVTCGTPNRKYGKLGHPGDLLGWQETFAEIKFFEDFPEGPRKEATYRTDYDWENFSDQVTPVFKKIVGPGDEISLDDFDTNRNDFYMRYAEVLLIYAEASGRSGNVTTEAWESLNKIRRRAEGLPFDEPNAIVDVTSGDIAELAFAERKWEFAGEFIRWNDLVRMERVEEALSDRVPRVSRNAAGELVQVQNEIIGSLGTDNYFAPIPTREIILNPNLDN
ncbi:RagB/SusD family nutrient uptake outer membrane protein [Flavivirga rizhaonensis]|uniref:RagB/SusD family nutrient uptake outer membrane protein n=1 Tax=Flavivirga rizhaonensis TaxID=2559571 RepID=A0A4S1E1X4_9FLAO|nr:RagB/SusD family nutrient uptake outer membrane protein [Flavivirga rizhaonensis]TGV04375.1 RagB/SusD family nutrient uptake outer membrane protein [Flavivirga rizhaonensis]